MNLSRGFNVNEQDGEMEWGWLLRSLGSPSKDNPVKLGHCRREGVVA